MKASLATLRAAEQQHYRCGIAAHELELHIEHLIKVTRSHRKVAADSYTRPLLLKLERALLDELESARAQIKVKAAKHRAAAREVRRLEKAGVR